MKIVLNNSESAEQTQQFRFALSLLFLIPFLCVTSFINGTEETISYQDLGLTITGTNPIINAEVYQKEERQVPLIQIRGLEQLGVQACGYFSVKFAQQINELYKGSNQDLILDLDAIQAQIAQYIEEEIALYNTNVKEAGSPDITQKSLPELQTDPAARDPREGETEAKKQQRERYEERITHL